MRDLGGPLIAGASRHVKLAGRRSKASPAEKSRKVSRKSLSSDLSSSEDAFKELSDFSALTEALVDANPDGETTEITDYSTDVPLESTRSNDTEIASLGVDELANLLGAAQKHVLESFNANNQFKKLLDALIKDKLDESSTLSEQRAHPEACIRLKVLVPFLFLVFGVLLFFAFSSGSESSHGGMLPT